MVELKTPREIAAMRVRGAFVAELLDDLAERARPGVNCSIWSTGPAA